MSNLSQVSYKIHATLRTTSLILIAVEPTDNIRGFLCSLVTISEGPEERVSNSSISRDLCSMRSFFPNAWEQISIQSLLLGPGVKVRNGKSENEVSLHFFRRCGENDEGGRMKLAQFLQPLYRGLSLRFLDGR